MALNVTLDLPENLILDLKDKAQTQHRSIAEVVREMVLQNWQPSPKLPADVESELAAMSNLSDEVLWLLVRNTMTREEQEMLAALNITAKEHTLKPEEEKTLERLLQPSAIGGLTVADNLCLARPRCNRHKATRIEALDAITDEAVPLYNPRQQVWGEHFEWRNDGIEIGGLTATGRVTIDALQMNNPFVVRSRKIWVEHGWHPPSEIPL